MPPRPTACPRRVSPRHTTFGSSDCLCCQSGGGGCLGRWCMGRMTSQGAAPCLGCTLLRNHDVCCTCIQAQLPVGLRPAQVPCQSTTGSRRTPCVCSPLPHHLLAPSSTIPAAMHVPYDACASVLMSWRCHAAGDQGRRRLSVGPVQGEEGEAQELDGP